MLQINNDNLIKFLQKKRKNSDPYNINHKVTVYIRFSLFIIRLTDLIKQTFQICIKLKQKGVLHVQI